MEHRVRDGGTGAGERNRIAATVCGIERGRISSVVRMEAEGQILRAVITTKSLERMGLGIGSPVYAGFDSHEVLLMQKPLPAMSAGNIFESVIRKVRPGDVMAIVDLDAGGIALRSWITREAAESLALRAGQTIVAVVKSTEIRLELRNAD